MQTNEPYLAERIGLAGQFFQRVEHAGPVVADREHVAAAAEMISRLRRHPLRTLDALHLAIALAIKCRQLATADRTMADAARASGLEVVRFF